MTRSVVVPPLQSARNPEISSSRHCAAHLPSEEPFTPRRTARRHPVNSFGGAAGADSPVARTHWPAEVRPPYEPDGRLATQLLRSFPEFNYDEETRTCPDPGVRSWTHLRQRHVCAEHSWRTHYSRTTCTAA